MWGRRASTYTTGCARPAPRASFAPTTSTKSVSGIWYSATPEKGTNERGSRMASFQRLMPAEAPAPRRAYPSDLTDAQGDLLEPLLRARESSGPGRPATVELREVVNALLYIKQTGCPWRYLPHDFPPRSTVHYYFAQWTADGTLEALVQQLREQSRGRAGRAAQPTAGVIDSQTVKSVEATQAVGWDGGK